MPTTHSTTRRAFIVALTRVAMGCSDVSDVRLGADAERDGRDHDGDLERDRGARGRAVNGGDASRALTLLESYRDRFPHGVLREERDVEVVLVSDVSAGNEARLLRKVPGLLGAGAKLFVLGVGASLDRRLAERVARAGGGVFEALPSGGGAAESLARFGRRVLSLIHI